MTDVSPGSASYEETLARIASIISQGDSDLADVKKMSADSFREWLDSALQRAARQLGIAVAAARAFLDDLAAVFGNAGTAFGKGYRESYDAARRVKRLK